MKLFVTCATFALLFAVLFVSAAEAKRMTFVATGSGGNCNECEFTVADGDIAIDSVDDFREAGGKRVLINSPGGSLEGAIALGEEMRRQGVVVIVSSAQKRDGEPWYDATLEGSCLSACVYALFGGVERRVPAKSSVGIHAFADEMPDGAANAPMYTRLELTAVQRLTGLLLEYTQRMGVDPLVIDWAAKQDNAGMRILNSEELLSLRVTWKANLAGNLRLEPYKNGLLARTETPDANVKVTLVCVGKELRLVFATPISGEPRDPRRTDGPDNPDARLMTIVVKANEDDFGDWIEYNYKFSKDLNNSYSTVTIDRDNLMKMTHAQFVEIALGTTRGAKEYRLIRMPTDGLAQIVALLGRNCI